MTFKNCRLVAAANTPHGMLNTSEAEDLFVKQQLTDPAIFNRLSLIPVTPQQQYPSWVEYIKSAGWHKHIVSFCIKKSELRI